MARLISTKELDLIEKVISEHPEEIRISALEETLAHQWPNVQRRTLQRRLKQLQEEKRIITEGESIALVYKCAPPVMTSLLESLLPLKDGFTPEPYVPLSKESSVLRDLIRQPLIQRKPVGYQRAFLGEYH